MSAFFIQLAQTSQQSYMEDPQAFLARLTVFVAIITAGILAIFKLINLIIDQYWGTKKNWQRHVDESIAALSKASPVSSVKPTDDDIQKIESNANGTH